MKYIIVFFMLLTVCAKAQQTGYNGLKVDSTLRNSGSNKTGFDTVKFIATKSDIAHSGTGSVTSVAAGLWMSFSTITTTGNVSADSSTISSYLVRRKDSTKTFVTVKQLDDSIAAHPPSSGTVTSVGIIVSNGILIGGTASPITTSGTFTLQNDSSKYSTKFHADSIAGKKINYTDTLNRSVDTKFARDSAIAAHPSVGTTTDTLKNGLWITGGNFNGAANITLSVDSAGAAVYFLRRKDSTSVYQSFYQGNLRVKYTDTSAMLSHYMDRADSINGGYYPYTSNPKGYSTTTGTVTSVATGLGLSGGTITTAGTLLVDTASANILSRQRAANTYAPISVTGTVTSIATAQPITGGTITTTGTIGIDTSANQSAAVTHYQLNNTDSVGTIIRGVWNGTTIAVANGGTAATNDSAARINLVDATSPDIARALGSNIIAQSFDFRKITTTGSLATGLPGFQLIDGWLSGTITGVTWYQSAKGSYVASNYNGIAIYSYSGGTVTLVDSTTRGLGDIWQQAATSSNQYVSKSFDTPFTATKGTVYFVVWLYSAGSGTAPSFGAEAVTSNAIVLSGLFTNSAKVFSFLNSVQTTIPPSQAMSGLTGSTSCLWFGVNKN